MGQHGINIRVFGTLIPPFLPISYTVEYSGYREQIHIHYPVELEGHPLDVNDFSATANGVPVNILNATIYTGGECRLEGQVFEHWEDPVLVSYDGSDPGFRSISGVPCEEFTDELCERT